MTRERDFDRIAQAFMADGPTQLADRVLDDALAEVHQTSQRRVFVRVPWRFPLMNTFARVALAAVAIVAVGAVGLAILRPGSSQVGAPTASPSPAASTAPSASPSSAAIPELTETFTSANYGYSVGYAANSTIEPATALWWPPDSSAGYEGFDFITSQELGVFRSASVTVPEGVSLDDWIEEFITGGTVGTCNPPRATLPEFTIDGQSGRIREGCPDEIEATVVVGRRAYVFTLFSDSRVAFEALAATIDLRPEDAVEVPSPAPS